MVSALLIHSHPLDLIVHSFLLMLLVLTLSNVMNRTALNSVLSQPVEVSKRYDDACIPNVANNAARTRYLWEVSWPTSGVCLCVIFHVVVTYAPAE